METYEKNPARNYKHAGVKIGNKIYLANSEVKIGRLGLTDYMPVLITKYDMFEIRLYAMESTSTSYNATGFFYKDAKLLELAAFLMNRGAMPHNHRGLPNAHLTFITPKGPKGMHYTLEETGAFDCATYTWGFP